MLTLHTVFALHIADLKSGVPFVVFREGINQDLLQLSPSVTEQFIELLCQYEPDQVLETLQFLEVYRLEETIQVRQNCLDVRQNW